jgi:hypothetical protein
MLLNDLTPEHYRALANAHVKRFEQMLAAYATGRATFIRPDECEMYLHLWRSVRAKAEHGVPNLTTDERIEVLDALADGSYDDLLATVAS